MNRLQSNTKQKTKRSFLSSNPIMRRLDSVDEHADSNCATYGGITLKTMFFLLFSVVGILAQALTSKMLAEGESSVLNIKGFKVSVTNAEIIVLLAVLLAGILLQLLAFFLRSTTPVTGALYCASQGYFISFLLFKVLGAYKLEYLGFLALLITMLIIAVMSILYTTGVIRVTKKFKMVITTLFVTMIATSLFTFIGSFIPAFQPLVKTIQNNFALSIAASIGFIIIAALFLICDFDTIDHVVNDKLPKKYEWQAAFGLSFTILWLYLKVLDLIITIAGNNNKD